MEVDRTTVGSPWSVGWDSNDAPTTAGTYMLVAEWRDRGPVDEGPHTESVSVSLFAPQDYYESNGGPENVCVTMDSWGDITGKSVYFAYSDQKSTVLQYASFSGSRDTDTDIHIWTDDQGELLSDSVTDNSWGASGVEETLVAEAGTYEVTAFFYDDDNPRGTTEPDAPEPAGSNDTGDSPLEASATLWAIKLSLPELGEICSFTETPVSAEATPNPGGEYNWSTTESSGVKFVLADGTYSLTATGQSATIIGLAIKEDASITVSFTSDPDDLGRTVALSDTATFDVVDAWESDPLPTMDILLDGEPVTGKTFTFAYSSVCNNINDYLPSSFECDERESSPMYDKDRNKCSGEEDPDYSWINSGTIDDSPVNGSGTHIICAYYEDNDICSVFASPGSNDTNGVHISCVFVEILPDPCSETERDDDWELKGGERVGCPTEDSNPLGVASDGCGNRIELWCTGSHFEWKYFANGSSTPVPIGECVYYGGDNELLIWYTTTGERYHSFKHLNMESSNQGPCDHDGDGKWDWNVTTYNCITGDAPHNVPYEKDTPPSNEPGYPNI